MNKDLIIDYIWRNPYSSKAEILQGTGFQGSESTLKRVLSEAVDAGVIIADGQGRAVRYAPGKYPDGIQTFEKIRTEG